MNQTTRWDASVARIRANPDLRESILRSVMSSMELAGFEVDHERSKRLLDQALDGPPLLYPGADSDESTEGS